MNNFKKYLFAWIFFFLIIAVFLPAGVVKTFTGVLFFFTLLILIIRLTFKDLRYYKILFIIVLIIFIYKISLIPLFQILLPQSDETTGYHNTALMLFDCWNGKNEVCEVVKVTSVDLYSKIIAVIYYVFGVSIFLGRVSSIFLNLVTGVLAFHMSKDISNKKNISLITMFLVWLYPELTMWSSYMLRDTLIVFFILSTIYFFLKTMKEKKIVYLILFFVCVYLLETLRRYILIITLASLTLYSLLNFIQSIKKNQLTLRNFAFLFLSILIFWTFFQFSDLANLQIEIESLNFYRQSNAAGDSVFFKTVEYKNLSDVLSFLPIGGFYFLFAPFPHQGETSLRVLILIVDFFLRLVLHILAVYGIVVCFRAKKFDHLILLIPLVLIASFYALLSPNVGTIIRYRIQITVFEIIFAGASLNMMIERLRHLPSITGFVSRIKFFINFFNNILCQSMK